MMILADDSPQGVVSNGVHEWFHVTMLLSDMRGEKGLPHAILGVFLASPTDQIGVSVSGRKARNQIRFQTFLVQNV